MVAGKTIPLNALWDEHLILREEGSGTRNILEQMLAEQNHTVKEFRRITTFSNFGLMTKLLPATGGITFAYQAVLDQTDHLAPFHVNGWKIVREFNYVFLDTPFSREAVEYFDSQKRKRGCCIRQVNCLGNSLFLCPDSGSFSPEISLPAALTCFRA